jgi:hypothetical protein
MAGLCEPQSAVCSCCNSEIILLLASCICVTVFGLVCANKQLGWLLFTVLQLQAYALDACASMPGQQQLGSAAAFCKLVVLSKTAPAQLLVWLRVAAGALPVALQRDGYACRRQ